MEKLKKCMSKFGNIILIIIMAIIFVINFLISYNTELDSHPDELSHYNAVKYYVTHNLPPKLDDDEIADTFSVHGESRLTELDSYYFLVGKFTSILNKFSNNELFNARSFNLVLLIILLVMCYKLYKNNSYLFMPFLLTSQVWYIFAYINNDAWAMFLNLIFIYQLFFKNSMFNKLINSTKEELSQNKKKTVASFILLGILFYSLLVAKVNYLVATGLSAIIYLIINHEKVFHKENILKIVKVLLIGVVIFGIRLGIDYKINGLDRLNMERIRVLRANEQFVDPYPAGEENNTGFKWKERGVPIEAVTKSEDFYTKTICSFIGVYGYMDYYSSDALYNVIKILYIIFVVYIIIYNIIKKDEKIYKRILPVIIVTFGGLLSLGLSLYRSYTYDYQPQGRYLFAIIPLMCALMYNQKKSKLLEAIFFVTSIVLIIMYIKYGVCNLL